MSTELIKPKRTEPIVDTDRSPTKRFFQFMSEIPAIADAQTDLTITWTTHAPTATTAVAVADGSSITAAETALVLQSLNARLKALVSELTAAGVISS